MSMGYQQRDFEIIDYHLFTLRNIQRSWRGPRPENLDPKKYFVCIGAAQTFGCFAEYPYPALLSSKLSTPVLNLGVAGAGPSFFLERPMLIEYMNSASFAIIQVMSGRSVSNSLFKSHGGEMLVRRSDGKEIGAIPAYRELLSTNNLELIDRVVHETRSNWTKEMLLLAEKIRIPKVLFWFSTRSPDYQSTKDSVTHLFGKFPQFITMKMMQEIISYFNHYSECISSEGLPQPLISRFTGKLTSIKKREDMGGGGKFENDYYPSPQMHIRAFEVLLPACRELLNSTVS